MWTGNARVTAAVVAVLLAGVSVCSAKVIYVDADATGANNGSSWADAYSNLQNALEDASGSGEIRVAQGTYKPGQSNRNEKFDISGDLVIKGGYAGWGKPDPDARDVHKYLTVFSGDLAGNDVEVAAARDLLTEPSRTENSSRILVTDGYGEGGTPVLEGFTITGAKGDVSGGGLYINYGDAIVTDCLFVNNSTADHGGAMAFNNGRVIFTRCRFIQNAAQCSGGAVYLNGCGTCRSMYGAFIDCIFTDNYCSEYGGAIHNTSVSMATCINCLFVGNTAVLAGGALYDNGYDLGSHLVNCTLSGNNHGAIYIAQYGSAKLTNCILWDNLLGTNTSLYAQISWERNEWWDNTPVVNYSCIQDWDGSFGGVGNFSANPLFVSPGSWDLDLNYTPGDYHLKPDSPCINAGDPSYVAEPTNVEIPPGYYWPDHVDPDDYVAKSSDRDLDGGPRLVGDRVDMGAYEYGSRKTIYVDRDASGAEDGSSWADAFRYLQDALRAATGRDRILVAEGVYKPDQGIYQPPCERTATFQLISGVAIRGGYAGYGQPDPNARDIELYETILSGDLRGNDTEFDSSEWQGIFDFTSDPNRAENSYSVVTGSGTDSTAVLDGFTITGGNANGPILGRCPDIDYRLAAGAGMYNACGSPTVLNCTFRRNTTRSPYGCSGSGCPAEADAQALAAAGGFYCSCASFSTYLPATCGAGMFNCSGSPTLHNCIFEENISFGADAFSAGGGMFNLDSYPVLVNCTFTRNMVTGFDNEYYGGAVYDHSSTSTFTNCSFINNDSHQGGALYSGEKSTATITDCLFVGNSAQHGSGAIHSSGIRLDLAGSTFAGNRGASWDGESTIGGDNWQNSSLKVVNCILWNGGNEVSSGFTVVEIIFSDIEGGWEGQGNINVDPRFAQPGRWDDNGTPDADHDDFWVDGDYHLKSQAGRWNASERRWTIDDVTSPCIDAGDPLGQIGLEPFPNGGIVNMGAYGGTAEASKSYFGRPPCEVIVAGDINGDCRVDFLDFRLMALHWLDDYGQ